MRFVKWALAILAVLVVIIGGLAVFVSNMDVNRFKPEIVAAAQDATGRKLDIAGDLKLSIFPKPAVSVKGISFANAAWGSRPEMAKVGEFSAEVDLFALIGRRIQVDRLVLADVDVLLEKDRQGRANWEFSAPAKPQAQPQPQQKPAADDGSGIQLGLPTLNNLLMKNIKLAYREAGQPPRDVRLDEFSLQSASGGTMAAKLRANFDGNDIVADGSFGTLAEMISPSKPWPVKLALSIPNADLKANLEGSIANPAEGKGYAVKLSAAAPDIAKLAKLAGQTAPSFGPLNLSADVKEQGGQPAISNLNLALGEEKLGRVQLTGAIAQPLAQKGLALAIAFATPDAKKFAAALGAEVAQAVPVTAKFSIKDTGPMRFAVSDIAAQIATSDIAGSGEVALAGARPAVKFDLASKSLDLTPLLGESGQKAAGGGASGGTSGGAAGGGGKSDGRVFSDEPLPLDGMKAADAELRFKADAFKAPMVDAKAVNVALTLKDGALSVKPFGLNASGGSFNGEFALNAASKALRVKLDGAKFGLSDYLKAQKISDVISRDAVTDMAVDLTSQGGSVRQLMAGMNGKVVLKVGEGELRDQYLDVLGGDFLGGLGKLGQATAKTKLECVVAGLDIKSGIATPKAILMETGRLGVVAEGEINLGTEQLALKVVPSPRDAGIAPLAVPVRVGGTFAKPSFAPDAAAAAKGALGAVAGAALMGPAAILMPMMSSGSSDSERGPAACAKAVALAEGKPVPQSSTAKSGQQQQQQQQSGNPLQNLQRGLGGLLKR